jgi:hypothetical protein
MLVDLTHGLEYNAWSRAIVKNLCLRLCLCQKKTFETLNFTIFLVASSDRQNFFNALINVFFCFYSFLFITFFNFQTFKYIMHRKKKKMLVVKKF